MRPIDLTASTELHEPLSAGKPVRVALGTVVVNRELPDWFRLTVSDEVEPPEIPDGEVGPLTKIHRVPPGLARWGRPYDIVAFARLTSQSTVVGEPGRRVRRTPPRSSATSPARQLDRPGGGPAAPPARGTGRSALAPRDWEAHARRTIRRSP